MVSRSINGILCLFDKEEKTMRYIVDNDLHIHSKLSLCSKDPEQTNERILQYARENGLTTICLTDHFWDEAVDNVPLAYVKQNYPYITAAKPLPQDENIRFLFGCETDINRFLQLGLSKEKYDCFDFICIPTTHFHMVGYTMSEEELASAETRAEAWVKRFDVVLNMDLPFHKVGFAHLTCELIARPREAFLKTISLIQSGEMTRLFSKAARLGAGIEINLADMSYAEEEADIVLRPYRIAKECGCKFYLGSDAHRPSEFENAKVIFEKAVDVLGLTEDDKFVI